MVFLNNILSKEKHFGQRANYQDFNINDFVAAVELDGEEVLPIKLSEFCASDLIDINRAGDLGGIVLYSFRLDFAV